MQELLASFTCGGCVLVVMAQRTLVCLVIWGLFLFLWVVGFCFFMVVCLHSNRQLFPSYVKWLLSLRPMASSASSHVRTPRRTGNQMSILSSNGSDNITCTPVVMCFLDYIRCNVLCVISQVVSWNSWDVTWLSFHFKFPSDDLHFCLPESERRVSDAVASRCWTPPSWWSYLSHCMVGLCLPPMGCVSAGSPPPRRTLD